MTDTGAAWVMRGSNFQGVSGAQVAFTTTSAANVTPAPPVATQKVVVDDIFISSDVAARVDLLEETSGTVLLSVHFAGAGFVQITPRNGLTMPTANKRLQAQWSATPAAGRVTVNGHFAAPVS